MIRRLWLILLGACGWTLAASPPRFSGIDPHLAHCNEQGECGTGAIVPAGSRRRGRSRLAPGFPAYRVRVVADRDCLATAWLSHE